MFKHPTAYMWAIGVQREMPLGFALDVTYVGRRGLYLQRERNINQLQPGTVQANPGVNIAALRPYTGYGVIRVSENVGQLDVQQPADQRRPPLQERPEVRRRLHARQVRGQREQQAQRSLEHATTTPACGAVELRPPPRLQLLLHLRPAVLRATRTR